MRAVARADLSDGALTKRKRSNERSVGSGVSAEQDSLSRRFVLFLLPAQPGGESPSLLLIPPVFFLLPMLLPSWRSRSAARGYLHLDPPLLTRAL
jgi:hypothetical protein